MSNSCLDCTLYKRDSNNYRLLLALKITVIARYYVAFIARDTFDLSRSIKVILESFAEVFAMRARFRVVTAREIARDIYRL